MSRQIHHFSMNIPVCIASTRTQEAYNKVNFSLESYTGFLEDVDSTPFDYPIFKASMVR